MGRILPEGAGPRPELERVVLREMRRAFRERTVAAVVAVFGAAMALVCLPDSASNLIEALRKGGAWVAAGFCVVSLGAVGVFLRRCAVLRGLGLPRARGIRAYFAWQLAGSVVSFAVIVTGFAWFGGTLRSVGVGMLPGLLLATWVGRKLNQIPDADEARADERRVQSLFQDEDDRTGG
ncbi:MAG TPA: hypothetical protein PLF84_19375 [Bryobacteraceae bacterium]|nr:hypothetical protein [Bryobacteraceae bacterium]